MSVEEAGQCTSPVPSQTATRGLQGVPRPVTVTQSTEILTIGLAGSVLSVFNHVTVSTPPLFAVQSSKPDSFVLTLITFPACHTSPLGKSRSHICTKRRSLGQTTELLIKCFFQSITKFIPSFNCSTVTFPTPFRDSKSFGIFIAMLSSINSNTSFLEIDLLSFSFGNFFKTVSIIFCSSASLPSK